MSNHVTAYTEIARKMTLPIRQDSLFKIIPAAQMAADESQDKIYIIHSPFYVDEHVDSQHVYATKEASLILYKQREGIEWAIDAVVEPNGEVFFARAEDALLVAVSHIKEKKNDASGFKDWSCPKCGHEVMSTTKPQPIKWTDGHVCHFREAKNERA